MAHPIKLKVECESRFDVFLNFRLSIFTLKNHESTFISNDFNQLSKYIISQKDNGIHFVYEQVMIARERIIHIQPKVIVVSNTKAKELMGKNRFKPKNQDEEVGVWMDFQFEFDMEYGSHRITNVPELAQTHVFFHPC